MTLVKEACGVVLFSPLEDNTSIIISRYYTVELVLTYLIDGDSLLRVVKPLFVHCMQANL